jgi:hypothetical protein
MMRIRKENEGSNMNPHLKYLITGDVFCAEGGPFLMLGIEYSWLGHLFGLSFLPIRIWAFIIIGTVS